MTKEELEKEATEYTNKWLKEVKDLELYHKTDPKPKYIRIKEAYLASAEPREKQIQIDAEQILALQKQNGELTDKVNDLEDKLANADFQLEGRDNEIAELKQENKVLAQNLEDTEICENGLKNRIAGLEAQIEKMKNCKNCANYMISGKCPSFFRTGWCKNWEMTKGGKE